MNILNEKNINKPDMKNMDAATIVSGLAGFTFRVIP